MNKVKFFRSFMVLTIFITWSIPQSGQAVDWFGNSSQEKIKYYEGYNAALAAVTTNALPLPIKTSVSSTDLSNLQKQINVLTTKVDTLELTTDIDDWGFNDLVTSTDNFVTNPMTNDLDVGNFSIRNYGSDLPIFFDGSIEVEGNTQLDGELTVNRINSNAEAVYFNSDVNLGASTLFGRSLNFTTMEDNSTLLRSFARSNDSTAGNFGAIGTNSFGVWSLAEGTVSRAGYFEATGDGAIGIVASGHGEESLAGAFNGPVVIENGNLTVDRIDSSIEAVYFDSNINIDGDVMVEGQLQLGNNNIGNSIIRQSNMFWGGPLIVSNTDVGVMIDANNDESVSAFRIMRDGDDFNTAKEIMAITTDPTGEHNLVEITKGTFVVNDPQEYLRDPSLIAPTIGVAVAADDFALSGWSLNDDSGAGVLGSGFHGVEGRAIQEGGSGIYGEVAGGIENAWAGYFDGPVKMINGSLEIEDISPRVHLKGNTPGIEFSSISAPANNKNWSFIAYENNFYGDVVGDHFSGGYHWLEVIRDDLDVESVNFPLGKVGVGTSNPNKQLHVYSSSTNAEIDIQTGSNTHWGIYQDNNSGNLNFWHGNNKVSFTDQGLSTNGICLDGQCVNSWKDLKKYLEPKVIVDPDIYPDNPVVR